MFFFLSPGLKYDMISNERHRLFLMLRPHKQENAMSDKYDLNVQCFSRRKPEILFSQYNDPKLLYVSYVRPSTNSHPRILHSHKNHAEILLVFSGQSEFLIGNRKQLIREGDIVIYNSGIVHDDLTDAQTSIGYYCVAIGDIHFPSHAANSLTQPGEDCVYPAGRYFDSLKDLCRLMFESLSQGSTDAETFCRSLTQAFLVRIISVIQQSAGKNRTQNDTGEDLGFLGVRAKAYIDEHYMEAISLPTIADALNVSPYYLSHTFKQATGYSPIQYLLRRRIGEAQTLLISSSLSIAEIAGLTGFDSQNYFNAQFTKHVGIPPGKFRSSYVVHT